MLNWPALALLVALAQEHDTMLESARKKVAGLVTRAARAAGCELIPSWRLSSFPLARHLHELLSRLAVDCVIDVGANRGQFHDFLRTEVGYQGYVASFEPQASCLQQLRARAPADKHWGIYGFALGNENSQRQINVMRSNAFTSFLLPDASAVPALAERNTVSHVEMVQVRRVDDVIDDLRRVTDCRRIYLKLDTQGYDLEVIEGAKTTLASVAALQTEVSVLPIYHRMPDWQTAVRTLKRYHFDVTGFFPVTQDPYLRVVEFDCVAVNAAQCQRPT